MTVLPGKTDGGTVPPPADPDRDWYADKACDMLRDLPVRLSLPRVPGGSIYEQQEKHGDVVVAYEKGSGTWLRDLSRRPEPWRDGATVVDRKSTRLHSSHG